MRRTHIGDFSKPVSIRTINERNREFHERHSATPQLDPSGRMNWRTGDSRGQSTAFRDAQHAAAHAATPRERIGAMNAAAKAFWSSGEPATVTADMLGRPSTGTGTVASINEANRAFWAGRC